MVFGRSDRRGRDEPAAFEPEPIWMPAPLPVKVVIAGGFAVGKTTFVGSISEIVPLTTEAALTRASEGIDHLVAGSTKTATTVALDFGRITLSASLVLYLFGTPGQSRFMFLWEELTHGAIGAVVLVDTARLADCFAAIDFFESQGLPFIIAINTFDGVISHDVSAVREALAVNDDIPVVYCDARERESARDTLITLTSYVLERATAR